MRSFTLRFCSSKTNRIAFTKCSLFHAKGDKVCRKGCLLSGRTVQKGLSRCMPLKTLASLRDHLGYRLSGSMDSICGNCLKISVVVYQFPRGRGATFQVRPYMRVGLHVGVKIVAHFLCSYCMRPSSTKYSKVSCRPSRKRTLGRRRQVSTACPLRVERKGMYSNCLPLIPIRGEDYCQT